MPVPITRGFRDSFGEFIEAPALLWHAAPPKKALLISNVSVPSWTFIHAE